MDGVYRAAKGRNSQPSRHPLPHQGQATRAARTAPCRGGVFGDDQAHKHRDSPGTPQLACQLVPADAIEGWELPGSPRLRVPGHGELAGMTDDTPGDARTSGTIPYHAL